MSALAPVLLDLLAEQIVARYRPKPPIEVVASAVVDPVPPEVRRAFALTKVHFSSDLAPKIKAVIRALYDLPLEEAEEEPSVPHFIVLGRENPNSHDYACGLPVFVHDPRDYRAIGVSDQRVAQFHAGNHPPRVDSDSRLASRAATSEDVDRWLDLFKAHRESGTVTREAVQILINLLSTDTPAVS